MTFPLSTAVHHPTGGTTRITMTTAILIGPGAGARCQVSKATSGLKRPPHTRGSTPGSTAGSIPVTLRSFLGINSVWSVLNNHSQQRWAGAKITLATYAENPWRLMKTQIRSQIRTWGKSNQKRRQLLKSLGTGWTKFVAPTITGVVMMSCKSLQISMRHQCITAMKEYEELHLHVEKTLILPLLPSDLISFQLLGVKLSSYDWYQIKPHTQVYSVGIEKVTFDRYFGAPDLSNRAIFCNGRDLPKFAFH